MRTNGVNCLLMGGQACVLYGGAEFSRDTDLVVLCDDANLECLQAALDDLQADVIAVPPFEKRYLDMGLAVHFRCQHPDALRMRVDVMSRLRGVDPFDPLWDRRTTLALGDEPIDMLSLPDLVAAKKTQRDKDWLMITRLLESHYFANRASPNPEQLEFWLRELRTPQLLIDLVASEPEMCELIKHERPLLSFAQDGDASALREALQSEADIERQADITYWSPLFAELERLRHERH